MIRSHVLVCGGTGCSSSNSPAIFAEFEKQIAAVGLSEEVKPIMTGCFGLCALGPIVVVYPEGAFYSRVKVEDVAEIVSEHLLKGRIVKRLLFQETVGEQDNIKSLNETNFYNKQIRRALPEGADPKDAWMIGDRCFDVDSGHALGMHSVAVGYGYGSVEEFEECGADRICMTVAELSDYLLSAADAD